MADERMELQELQREWRREVSDALKENRVQFALIAIELQKIREEFAREKEMLELMSRVAALERDKAKIIGGALILNFVGGLLLWFVAKLWK